MKKLVAALLLFAVGFSLAFFGLKSDKTDSEIGAAEETATVSEPAVATQTEIETVTQTTTEKPVTAADAKAVYKKTLDNILSGHETLSDKEDVYIENVCFSLIYLDGDEIPELVVSTGFNHTAQAVIYSFDGSNAVKKGAFGSFGKFMYIPQKGIVKSEYSGMGITDTEYYSFEKGSMQILSSLRKSVDIYDKSAKPAYYLNGTEVSAESYESEMNKYDSAGDFINAPEANLPGDSGNLPDGVYYLTAGNISKL